jgi:hypothetical protein
MWEYAARTAANATARIRYCAATGNPADAANATARIRYCTATGNPADAADAAERRLGCAARGRRRARQPHPAPGR